MFTKCTNNDECTGFVYTAVLDEENNGSTNPDTFNNGYRIGNCYLKKIIFRLEQPLNKYRVIRRTITNYS